MTLFFIPFSFHMWRR